jgi:hypothetical protein
LIEPHEGDTRYVRRDAEGRFTTDQVDVHRSLWWDGLATELPVLCFELGRFAAVGARRAWPSLQTLACEHQYIQKAVRSLSLWSSESHAVKCSGCGADASQAATRVVLPNPAGAETSVSRASIPRLRRSLSRGRATVAARLRGT